MKSLFDPAVASDMKVRVQHLRPDSPRQWGRMDVAQAVAHLATSLEQALGDSAPPRMLVGRVLGPVVKHFALKDDAPFGRNAPTAPSLKVVDQRDLDLERTRLLALIDRVAAGGPAACANQAHVFFGRMVGDEWGRLMYKHLDHHLRQFGA